MRNKILIVLLITVMVIASMGLSACSSNKATPTGTTGADGQVQNSNVQTTTSASTTNANAGTTLKNLMTKAATLKYKVTYTVKSYAPAGTITNVMTQYFMLPDKMRMDTSLQGMESRTYMANSKYTMCSKTGTDWMCLEQSYTVPENEKVKEEIKSNPAQYAIKQLASRTMAGVNAQCFQVTTSNTVVEYCYSAEGALLYSKSTADGKIVSEMEATMYSTAVTDADFEIPSGASTQNINDMMNNLPQDIPGMG